MLHLKLISCKVLQREISSIVTRCPNMIDITYMQQWYHDTPEILKKRLQEEIDLIDANRDPHTDNIDRHELDGILLGYGLCSNAVVGLKSKKYRLIIPRAHDCATLVMGSRERYQDYFENNKGSYFYTRGWLELGATLGDEEAALEKKRREYMEKYEDDEETVEFLLDMDRDLLKHYSSITYVEWPELADAATEAAVRSVADERNWSFHHMDGSNTLLSDMLYGNWNPEKFQIIEPGETATPSYDDMILKTKPAI